MKNPIQYKPDEFIENLFEKSHLRRLCGRTKELIVLTPQIISMISGSVWHEIQEMFRYKSTIPASAFVISIVHIFTMGCGLKIFPHVSFFGVIGVLFVVGHGIIDQFIVSQKEHERTQEKYLRASHGNTKGQERAGG
jgi:hypothetical protein